MILNQTLKNYWDTAVSYSEYKKIITQEAEKNINAEEEEIKHLAEFTQLNLTRIHRLDKTLSLSEEIIQKLEKVKQKFHLLIISEGWCGDASQIIPAINTLVENSAFLEMKITFRDQNELIDQYLTNGGKAIPILIILNKNFEEITHWGPRPQQGLDLLHKFKSSPETYPKEQFHKDLQVFYNHDKGFSVQNEILKILL